MDTTWAFQTSPHQFIRQSVFGPSRHNRIWVQAPCLRPWGLLGASAGHSFFKPVPDHLPKGVLSVVSRALQGFKEIGNPLGDLLASFSARFGRSDFQ